jgi:hypothetical protein
MTGAAHRAWMHLLLVAAVCALAALSFDSAAAGPHVDELAQCLVRSTSDTEKNALVRWFFAAMAVHPEVRSLAAVSDAQRAELSKGAAKLLERLMTESCRSQTLEAVRYEGPGSLQKSFEVLGEVAARGLFADPAVMRSLADLDSYIDKEKINRLFKPGP